MTGFVIFVVVMIVVGLINKARQQSAKPSGPPSPRVQKLLERIQAQQGGNQPVRFQGQFTQPQHPGQPAPVAQAPVQQYQPPATWLPSNQPPAHRPPRNNLPAPRQDLDTRVRQLMSNGNEVGAIRLLCDEQDLGILEAHKYARALVTPAGTGRSSSGEDAEPEEESRYVGSAAFAESIFDLDRDEEVWASGWVDTPEPDDRSDIDELWQTVRNPPRPGVTPSS